MNRAWDGPNEHGSILYHPGACSGAKGSTSSDSFATPPRRRSSVRAGDSTIGGRADTDKRSGAACPRWVGGMLASLTVPDDRLITRTCSFHCWRRRRGQQWNWKDQSLNVAISTQECYWTTPRDHRTHPPAALSPSRRLRGSVYHHVLSASGANTALLRGQKPTRARGRHGQKEAWGVGYTPSAGGG